jgi:hypothetical protein
MLTALADWPHRPVTPQGQLHSILTPIIDDLAAGGATATHVEMWPDEIDRPTVIHFTLTVTASRLRGSNYREHRRLVIRLAELGFRVALREPGDITKSDFHVLVSTRVNPTTNRLQTSGAAPRTSGATDDVGGIVKTLEQLKREYELHHMRPS